MIAPRSPWSWWIADADCWCVYCGAPILRSVRCRRWGDTIRLACDEECQRRYDAWQSAHAVSR